MKPKQLFSFLEREYEANVQGKSVRPILIRGPPGIGKTSIVNQVGAKNNLQAENGIEYLDAIVREPVDIGGLPYQNGHGMSWLPPDWSCRAQQRSHGILFVDDLGAAAPSMQAACFRLILEGKSGAVNLPKGWMRIAATNSAEDKTVHWKMPAPLVNRFHIVNLEPDGDEWEEWALQNGLDDRVLAYLKWRRFTCGKTGVFCQTPQYDAPFATPRSWHAVSDYLKVFTNPEFEVICGTVGEGPGTEFVSYLELYKDLVSAEDVLAGKVKFPKAWPNGQPDRAYAIISSLTAKYLSNPLEYVDAVVEILLTIPEPEFAVTLAQNCVKGISSKVGGDPLSKNQRYTREFYGKYKSFIFR